jgi:rod shape-determining protein MreD
MFVPTPQNPTPFTNEAATLTAETPIVYVLLTFVIGLMGNMMPWGQYFGLPDCLALVIVFWGVQQPQGVGMWLAWLFGVLMDVHTGSLLGEHALSYCVLSYGAMMLHRRIQWFKVPLQTLHLLPLFMGAQTLLLALRWLNGESPFDVRYWLDGVVTAALWLVVQPLLRGMMRTRHDFSLR